jgi:hypothetical protein
VFNIIGGRSADEFSEQFQAFATRIALAAKLEFCFAQQIFVGFICAIVD